ncbi:MAG: pentapeptide repeat-containing protein [Oculatellaceae cyanobacterium bins.114]|nr:pentapeptide repeat-containing protein [Oculatellaceae cyanobacterium bins.114]
MKENRLQMTVNRESTVISLAFATPHSDLPDSNLVGADLHNVDLSGADLSGVDLRNANLRGADLRGANLVGADLRGAALTNANLRGANLGRAMLSGATLSGTNLTGADLSNTILSGANLWDANLSGATLDRANLWDANLSGADLSGANLKGAILSSCDLRSANLSRSSLWGVNLNGANLSRAKLSNVDFSSTDLSASNLWNADLTSSDLSSALVQDTRFGQNQGLTEPTKVDLRQRGAIFVNTLADRKPATGSQFASKNEVSQVDSIPESAPSELPQQVLLPSKAASILVATENLHKAPVSIAVSASNKIAHPIRHSEVHYAPQSQPLPDTDIDIFLGSSASITVELNSAATEAPQETQYNEPNWIPEYDDLNSEEPTESSSWATEAEIESTDRYVSPIARTAAEIRSRRARLQAKNGKQNCKIEHSTMNFSYRF